VYGRVCKPCAWLLVLQVEMETPDSRLAGAPDATGRPDRTTGRERTSKAPREIFRQATKPLADKNKLGGRSFVEKALQTTEDHSHRAWA
jgi:hypothetical protein